MAHSLSAKKRIRQNEKRKVINTARKSAVKTQARKLADAMHDKKVEEAEKAFRDLTRQLDRTAAQGTIHRNRAARRKSRLQKQLNAFQGK